MHIHKPTIPEHNLPAIPKLLEIVGPTAAGKKRFALLAAELLGGEIVSADSRKVYRGLEIGAAKPSPADRARVPHHLVDIADPDEPFSAGDWVSRAREAVEDILARGRLPVLSGGTGFYLKAFREGLSAGIEPDPAVRAELERLLATEGPDALHRLLAEADPARAAALHPRDTVRVLRALEINRATGRTFADLAEQGRVTGGAYDWCSIGIMIPRLLLYQRIDERVDAMVAAGLEREAGGLLARYGPEAPGLATVGYREWAPCAAGEASREQCIEAIKRNTRRYAKRQLTWFRGRSDIRWMDGRDEDAMDAILAAVERWLDGGPAPVPGGELT